MRLVRPLVWLALTLACALAFHERYWRWRDCFNELGRCYDPQAGVMVEQAGWIWGGLMAIGLIFFVRDLLRLRGRRISR